jgi:geranylgeranyl pyrophosphate synthase
MVGGQALDLRAEGARLDAAALDHLHALKTGALLTASLVIGGLAGGAPPRLVDALAAYGRAIGLAFQITDDVLDATGSAEELGKHPSDTALEKTTYVALHGVEAASARAAAEVTRARAALDEVGIDDPALHALASYVVERRR